MSKKKDIPRKLVKDLLSKIKNAEKYYRIAVKISRDIGYKEGIKTALDSINRIRNAAWFLFY